MTLDPSNYGQALTFKAYNDTGATIPQGSVCHPNFVADVLVSVPDRPLVDPYANQAQGPFPTAILTTSADVNTMQGIAMTDILDGCIGEFVSYGYVIALTEETVENTSGDAYEVGGTAGQLAEATPGVAVCVVAVQVGDSGTTAAGDPRLVFFNGIHGMIDAANPMAGVAP